MLRNFLRKNQRRKQQLTRWYSTPEPMRSQFTQLVLSIKNQPGALFDTLYLFKKHDINIIHTESRVIKPDAPATFQVEIDRNVKDHKVQILLKDLKEKCLFVSPINQFDVPQFPTCKADLDGLRKNCIMSGTLEADHPGFSDSEYRSRRDLIAKIADEFSIGEKIPIVEYTNVEKQTWKEIVSQLLKLYPTHPCQEYQTIFPLLVEQCGLYEDNIPQLQDISEFLKSRTGFTLAPVSGLLSSREFLNSLAFRVFNSTQYLRHQSKPNYTPEPDIIHELMGHVPLLADPDFAEFTQTVGLASLGASDEDIVKLASCYWFTVEFGLVRQYGELRAAGAGLLSSFGELEYCVTNKPKHLPFDPEIASATTYPITEYQPTYFVCSSFKDLTEKMLKFSSQLSRPFDVEYNPYTETVTIKHDRAQFK
eukprot:TRINITY_DN11834_c0_g1_i1.p1 TRINITY_DN11834_c0_g1~~TRINITY_DN11834_c0_g1_i1.p1  ORF type:complete len:422 (-),score=72.92 TRINITY_DN11834_c0_g1_i1:44-1309(-)